MSRRIAISLVMAVAMGLFSSGLVSAKAGPLSAELLAVRAAVARYHDVRQALADGYSLEGEPCVVSPTGTMGYHAVDRAFAATGVLDPLRPAILLYVPRNHTLELAGVEYFRAALANTEAGPAPWFAPTPPPLGFFTPTPSLFGQAFDGPMPGHNPQMPWHFDLHAWVFEANPEGVLQPFNPAISC
jgi:hypothetical protein